MGSIRKIVFDDLKNIYELEKNIFIYSWSKKLVENQLRDQKALNLLSIRNNKILGYVFTKIYLDYIEIERIGVIHDERRKYIGEDLFETYINCIVHKMHLNVQHIGIQDEQKTDVICVQVVSKGASNGFWMNLLKLI